MIQRDVVMGHELGVHALVAHDLAEQAATFRSSLFLRSDGRTASLRSVIEVLALALQHGARVSVWADGEDEDEALDAIARLLTATSSRLTPQGRPPRPADEQSEHTSTKDDR